MMILLRLPMKDLLFAQLVCQRWKFAIENSLEIQRALFFEPGAAVDAPAHSQLIAARSGVFHFPGFYSRVSQDRLREM